jgi:TRAP-type C4-dicarboxylate transport system permease small subunit
MAHSDSPLLLARMLRKAQALSRAVVWVGGVIMLASVFLICFDVIARKLFQFSTNTSNELSGYAFAISTSWALGFGLLERINVRVDVLYRLFPVRVSAALDWLSTVAMGVFIGYLTYYAVSVAQTSWVRDAAASTTLGTPLWIPQSLWALGLVWMCIVLVLMLLRASIALVSGDFETVAALCGQRTAQEEARAEAEAGQRMVRGESPGGEPGGTDSGSGGPA